MLEDDAMTGMSPFTRGMLRALIRVVTIVFITIIGVFCPGFDRVMSFLGSLFCMFICIIFPVSFYLKLYAKDIGRIERTGLWVLNGISLVLAIVGTVWAFLPNEITRGHKS